MVKEEKIEAIGVVVESLPNATFKVKIIDERYPNLNNLIITAHISGKIRLHQIKILPGDEVKLELTTYDLTQGRIIYRNK